MKHIFGTLLLAALIGCAQGGGSIGGTTPATPSPIEAPPITYFPITYFPIATAVVSINSQGDIASYKKPKTNLFNLLISSAVAQVQANGVVSVVYTNPGATTFTLSTTGFMTAGFPTVSGTDLNLGSLSISGLDDNSLKVCTGVGAPQNKCNRLYIRVFTLGTNVSGSITGIQGFINTDDSYGIPVTAGSVVTPIGFNSSASAAVVTNSAQVFTYTIASNLNRVRLTDTGAITFPVKADLSNAGSGNYEMKLAVQYALGYQ